MFSKLAVISALSTAVWAQSVRFFTLSSSFSAHRLCFLKSVSSERKLRHPQRDQLWLFKLHGNP